MSSSVSPDGLTVLEHYQKLTIEAQKARIELLTSQRDDLAHTLDRAMQEIGRLRKILGLAV